MNATLVIHNSNKFAEDIWQYEADFSDKQWQDGIQNFAETLQEAYDFLSLEYKTEDGDEAWFPDDKLYIVGDIVNMLNAIDVRKEKRQ